MTVLYIYIYIIFQLIFNTTGMSHLNKICVRVFGLHKKKLPETRKTKFRSCEYTAPHWCIFVNGSTLKYNRTCNISRRTNKFIILNLTVWHIYPIS